MDFTSNGERVDIVFSTKINFDRLDMYQKSHLRRYQFASSLLVSDTIVGDIACGTGYGTVMMGATARSVNGYDISPIIDVVRKRYAAIRNVSFIQCDILQIKEIPTFDVIVSFETLEHFTPEQVVKVLQKFHSLLVRNGRLIISTPYNQEDSVASRVHHRSFNITEEVLTKWVSASHFTIEKIYYQNYLTHEIRDDLTIKDFMVVVCRKHEGPDLRTDGMPVGRDS